MKPASNDSPHLERLFDLHRIAVQALSKEGKTTDAENLDIVFRKFITLSIASFFEAETNRISMESGLRDKRSGVLLRFMTSFRMDEEDADPALTDAVDAYIQLREARDSLIHGNLAGREFDNWSTQAVKDKYDRAKVLLPKFREWAQKFTKKQRNRGA